MVLYMRFTPLNRTYGRVQSVIEKLVSVVHFTRDVALYVKLFFASIFVSGFGRFVSTYKELLIFINSGTNRGTSLGRKFGSLFPWSLPYLQLSAILFVFEAHI